MKTILPACLLLLIVNAVHSSPSLQAGAFEQAIKIARAENKHILVAFLGTGWSVSSTKFVEEVLSRGEFKEFAGKHLVYFPVEARRKPKLTSDETAVLQSLVIHFNVGAYPTFILIAPDGQELLRHGYREMDAQEYIQILKAILPEK